MKRATSFLLTWAMLLAMVPATVLAATGTANGTAAVRWDVYHEDGVDTAKKGWLTFDAAEFENHTVDFYRENGDEDVLLNSETTFCYPGDTAASANLFERDLIDPVVTGDYYAIITDSNGTAVQSPLYHYVRPEASLAVCDLAWDEDKRAATWTDEFADNSVVERYWVQFYCNPNEDNKADAEFVESLDFLPTDEPPCVLPDYILTTGGSGWYYFRVRVWTGDVTKAVTGKMSGLSGGIYLEAPAPSLSVEAPEWDDDMTMTWTDTSLKPEAVERYWVQFLCNHDADDPDKAYSVRYRNYYADKAPHVVPEAILEEGGSGWYYFRVQAISYDTTEVPDSLWSELSKGFYYEADTTGGDGEPEPAATPTDILWGVRRWQAGDYEEVPGMLSFDAKPGENYLMQFYRQEDSGDQLVFSYTVSCEKEDIYVTQNLFASYTKLDRVTSGAYYCVITPLGDDVNTCKGEPATSGIWEYVRPDNILTVSAPVWGENQAVCWTNEFTDGSALDYYRANFYFNPTEDNADKAEYVDFAIYRTGSEPFAAPAEMFDENGTGWYYFCMRTRSVDPTKALGTDYTDLSAALYYDPDGTIGCVHISGEAVVSRVEPTCAESGVETSVVTCTVCGEELSRTIVEIPALGHTPGEAVAENRVEPTETASGSYDSVVYCTVCSAQMSRETVALPTTGTPAEDADFPASAEETLTGMEKAVYDALQGCFKQIASGELETPVVKISMESLGLDGTFTAADLGVDALVEGSSITQEAVDALYAKLDFDSKLVIYALLADYPFDQFWFDKTKGVTISYPTCSSTGTTIRFAEDGVMTIRMAVSQEYAVMVDDSHYDPYAVDPAALETFGVAAARAKAQSIVQANADKSDIEKLAAYRDAICEAVTYNSFAAETDGYPYGNPWQLIYVFDGDHNTNVVCEGYAKAFQYLCDLTAFDDDIQCYTVDGVMDGGTGAGDHMWNVMLMPNGERYLVDITNCDEGSVGHPDYLFLAGDDNDGAYGNDCVITIPEHALDNNMIALGGTILYEYHSVTNTLWGSELLDIADSDYATSQEPPVHTHTEAVKTGTAATCTKTGLTDGTYCLTCGEELIAQQVIPALGHAEGETVEVERVEPTCTQNGHSITQRTCTNCGETVYSRVTQLPATGHTPGEAMEENRVEPTVKTEGCYDSVVYCTLCSAELSREKITIPALTEPTFAVSGLVTAHDGSQPGEAIAIALKQGSTTVSETRTNAAGVYLLNGVTAGIYNLVATQADGRSTVLLVEITEDGLLDTIALPEKNISTQVTVSQDSPAIVVGGLDAEAEASATDDQPLTMSMTLELKSEVTDNTDLSQEEQQLQETQEAIKAQVTEDADRTMLFLEIQVEKAQETISETINLLEIRVPYETRGRQNFQVLRHHEGEVQVLGETPNANGEYIQVFDGYIVIHAKMFSLYAITSLAEGAVHSHNWERVRYRWTKDGCTALQKCVGCEEELANPVEIKAKEGKLTLSQVPNGLRILICSYEGERMTGSLLLTQPEAENDLTLTGETLRIFFLNSRHQPLMEPLTVE